MLPGHAGGTTGGEWSGPWRSAWASMWAPAYEVSAGLVEGGGGDCCVRGQQRFLFLVESLV